MKIVYMWFAKALLTILVLVVVGCGAEGDDNEEELSANLSFEQEGVVYSVFGQPFENPLVSPLNDLNLEYMSSNEGVATIDQEGGVQLLDEGKTQISVRLQGSPVYEDASASYELIVQRNYLKCTGTSDVAIVGVKNNEYEYTLPANQCVGYKDYKHKKKKLPIKLLVPDERMQISEHAIVSFNASSHHVYTSYNIKNIGDKTYCFIQLNNIKVIDDNGVNQISEGGINFSFVEGSLHQVDGTNIATNTCLKPMQEGLVVDLLELKNIEDITAYEISDVSFSDSGFTEAVSVNAQTLEWDSGLEKIAAGFENNTGSKIQDAFSIIYYYDEEDVIEYHYLATDKTNIAISEYYELSQKPYRAFKSSRMRINLSYDFIDDSREMRVLPTSKQVNHPLDSKEFSDIRYKAEQVKRYKAKQLENILRNGWR